ncbi:hypothetical protein JX265_013007 [Neoarthrinium moseri]|uniref:Uncharacterized protein n=1 Tax=Neoarthrinium moseri TaxID=1658444 RepID=A0A9Q0AJ66_9PEZI|nr:hypothetical protein JX266_013706 [Neoarthrinium moseri]KAI1852548.1 hypothetical protein JX265_013007 [Neoarthrinium moseri]
MATKSSEKATSAMSKLSLDSPKSKPAAKTKKPVVADSWEDESSGDDENDENAASMNQQQHLDSSKARSSSSGFAAPPPTPSSPSYSSGAPWQSMMGGPDSPDTAAKRPEKTDAVARRMIASALGVKAPRLTEEQKAYERAMRDKERKRREEEKEQERRKAEEAERAKIAMWED